MKMILLKVMAGLTLGVAAGVLLAPQRGAETRQQLARGTARLRSRTEELASNVRESETRRRLMEEGAHVGAGLWGRPHQSVSRWGTDWEVLDKE